MADITNAILIIDEDEDEDNQTELNLPSQENKNNSASQSSSLLGDELNSVIPSVEDYDQIYSFCESDSESEDSRTACLRPIRIELPNCVLIRPKSCYEPFEPPFPTLSESAALRLLLPTRTEADDYQELQLNDFAVYCDTGIYPQEMRSLNHLDTESQSRPLYFNGVLSNGSQSIYVHRVRIVALPIGNYGQQSTDQTSDNMWLQSGYNEGTDVFYKLGTPATEYKRFFEPFLWVADLAKHVVDFLAAMHVIKQRVSIHHFRHDFAEWLISAYSPSFTVNQLQIWMGKYPRLDYRSAVNSNVAFLYKESIGALGNKATHFHYLWDEILHCTKFRPYQSVANDTATVVTSYIYNCFKHLPFGCHLKAIEFGPITKQLRLNLITQRMPSRVPLFPDRSNAFPGGCVKPGDTISTSRDTIESGTDWAKEDAKHDEHIDRWFALVQSISLDSDGQRVLEVIWYYRPVDTLCGLMKYPWVNELFLSDHCSCTESFKIRENEVLGVHDVEFGGTQDTTSEFFCRQMYLTEERAWVTLMQTHLKCSHETSIPFVDHDGQYNCGDTLLVHIDENFETCEPCEVVEVIQQSIYTLYTFRRLLRRHAVDPAARNARPNEIVYTSDLIQLGPSRIIGRCHVRWFYVNEPVPTPYDRDGVGAFFFMTHEKQLTKSGPAFIPLEHAPASLKQGRDPRQGAVPKLRGLDLFCGGGNFGRGLEEGGSVEMKWANDIDCKAIHTYMANTGGADQVSPFLGSIDDFQRLALEGNFASNIPQVGHVDFISGGSPCPGFSHMTNDRTTDRQRKNQSLVAAFASCVDIYRPKYGVLENVVGIIQKHRNRDQDVFSQLMCALVGMGYQARLLLLDALSYGSAQLRSRVFIMFAAPGWALPEPPMQTHSHPPNVKNLGLGKLPTGEPMAKREPAASTPFRYRSALQAADGLPKIYDGKPGICIPFPDHRVVSSSNTNTFRTRIGLIPRFPHGMNFSQAWYGYYTDKIRAAGRGVLSASERSMFPATRGEGVSSTAANSNSYGRQRPNQPMPTVVTRTSPADAKQGRVLHWGENRCLSIMEAKRGQGFRDEEVLVGPTAIQHKMIGNSVAREVSLALGVVFTEAVARSHCADFQGTATEEEDCEMEDTSWPLWDASCSETQSTPETSVAASSGTTSPTEMEGVSCQRLEKGKWKRTKVVVRMVSGVGHRQGS